MSPQQWKTIEKSLADLTLQDKLELVIWLMRMSPCPRKGPASSLRR